MRFPALAWVPAFAGTTRLVQAIFPGQLCAFAGTTTPFENCWQVAAMFSAAIELSELPSKLVWDLDLTSMNSVCNGEQNLTELVH